jgi:hypothetical protein
MRNSRLRLESFIVKLPFAVALTIAVMLPALIAQGWQDAVSSPGRDSGLID